MEHVVGIKVYDKVVGEVGFITWGRIFHPVDMQELCEIVQLHLPKFGIQESKEIQVCNTLQEVACFPYFYEGFFEFCQKIIPEGKQYKSWQKEREKALKKGEEIYFLGLNPQQKDLIKDRLGGTISHGFWYSFS
jgi:hypothetical protein